MSARIKAFELLGRSAGVFATAAPVKEEEKVQTPEALKRAIAGHIRTMGSVTPMRKRDNGHQAVKALPAVTNANAASESVRAA